MNLAELGEKIKSDQVFVVGLVILVGISGFGLGRLSKIEENMSQISIEAPASVALSLEGETANPASLGGALETDGEVVASKTGTKYHYPWCSGAKTIAEANKIWFNSTAEAREAGYLPAANCKGLK